MPGFTPLVLVSVRVTVPLAVTVDAVKFAVTPPGIPATDRDTGEVLDFVAVQVSLKLAVAPAWKARLYWSGVSVQLGCTKTLAV